MDDDIRPKPAVRRSLIGQQQTHCDVSDDNDDNQDDESQGSSEEENDDSGSATPTSTKAGLDTEQCNSVAKALSQAYRVLHPGCHICKRNKTQGNNFIHCKLSVPLGQQYKRLRHLMETRCYLQLIKDYTFRINSLSSFIRNLELIVCEESQSWYAISHSTGSFSMPETRLECLSAICEDLRVHIGHWNYIKQQMHTNHWLQPLLPKLYVQMGSVRDTLTRGVCAALYWIDKIIRQGLQVFSHTSFDQLTQSTLWSITRGIEEFNTVLNLVKSRFSQEDNLLNSNQSGTMESTYTSLNDIKQIPLSRILSILAGERSKYAAGATQQFFVSSKEVIGVVESGEADASLIWEDSYVPNLPIDSDYCSASKSHTSISDSLLKLGTLKAPDLTNQMSPVVTFARQEKDFADKFFEVVCHSTGLVRNKASLSSKTNMAISNSKPPSSQNDSAFFSRHDPKRKSVTWGDTADNSLKSQLTGRYMDLLWGQFSSHFQGMLMQHVWGARVSAEQQLGHLCFCSDTTVVLLTKMIQQTCMKDMFPMAAIPHLNTVTFKLQADVAMATWDTVFCDALASTWSDKCYPVPLADGVSSTKTGKLLKDSFQPLAAILASLIAERRPSSQTKGAAQFKSSQVSVLIQTLQRIILVCETSYRWCHSKSKHYLANFSIGAFLLVSHSDLKLLCDEIKHILELSQLLRSGTPGMQIDLPRAKLLDACWDNLHDVASKLQALSGIILKSFSEKFAVQCSDFFEETVPVGRVWRKKSNQDLPTECNEYAQTAMDTLLEPIVEGAAKLRSTAQISIISITVTTICDMWMQQILKERLRFSYYGACQLELDFGYASTFLEAYITNDEVRQSILALEAFKKLHGAVLLLKRQPHGRQSRGSITETSNNEYSMSTTESYASSQSSLPRHSNQNTSYGLSDNNIGSTEQEGDLHYKLTNMEQWLALRVHGGARNWPKLPTCFPVKE
ncbi:unnamed protein product [Owenia fusiformis]|uniref:Coiled-coil protein 142 C-terminal domain-containing protein n=1 Tax=Owenia fusiformis TaxID=6347 RepID=A0A8J1T726_OWEFU|nr:unnamed protein product [Owenia fusiformis]